MKNQFGQMTVEMVLFVAVIVLVVNMISKKFQQEALLEELTLNPWNSYIVGMIENGVWGKSDQTIIYHPHTYKRHSSVHGKDVQ